MLITLPAQIYTFPFAPNPEWSKFYASGDEILKYIQNVTDRFGLAENVHLNSRVVSTTWSDTKGRWSIKVEQRTGKLIEDEADILIDGFGILNRPQMPEIPQLASFKGKLIHSDGRVTAMHLGSILHYRELLESFRTEDFDYTYRSSNRFRFMGNGKCTHEKGGAGRGSWVLPGEMSAAIALADQVEMTQDCTWGFEQSED
jgi:hypothetical protein